MGSSGGREGGERAAGEREGWPGLFWSQTDMFRFEMSRAGSVTEEREKRGRRKEEVEGGRNKAEQGVTSKILFKTIHAGEGDIFCSYDTESDETKGQRGQKGVSHRFLLICLGASVSIHAELSLSLFDSHFPSNKYLITPTIPPQTPQTAAIIHPAPVRCFCTQCVCLHRGSQL